MADPSGKSPSPEGADPRFLVVAALVVTVGLAVAGTWNRTWGGGLVVGGWVLSIGALHRFGRRG